jgi:hypothetical protein
MLRICKLTLVALVTSLSLTACLTEEEMRELELEDLEALEIEAELEQLEAEAEEEGEDEEVRIDELAKPLVEHADVPVFPSEMGPDEVQGEDTVIPCDPPVDPLDATLGDDDELPPKPYGYDASEVPSPDDDEDCEGDDCEDGE